MEQMEQGRDSSTAQIADPNLDDMGELDYEPSEPSANSIKEAVSEDEEEGEFGDSDREEKRCPANVVDAKRERSNSNVSGDGEESEFVDSGLENQRKSDEATSDYSGPEEGEVDELEEGEVKESDGESETEKISMQKPASGNGREFGCNERQQKAAGHVDRHTQKGDPVDESLRQQQKRIPVTGPSSTSTGDGRAKNSQQGDGRTEDVGVCKFFFRGQCTWGPLCKYSHSFDQVKTDQTRWPVEAPMVAPIGAPVPLMALKADMPRLTKPALTPVSSRLGSPPSESAWERGVKQARERMKKAAEKREVDPDFEHKRLTMPLGPGVGVSLDECPSPIADQSNASGYTSSRPLTEFGKSGQFEKDGQLRGDGRGSKTMAPRLGKESAYNEFGGGNSNLYERMSQSMQAVTGSRQSRSSVGDDYPQPQEPRMTHRGNSPTGGDRNFVKDSYAPGPGPFRGTTQYHARHQSSLDEYGGRQYSRDRQMVDRPGGLKRDQGGSDAYKREQGPESQGWERRQSPPAFHRERGPNYERPHVDRRDLETGPKDDEPRFRDDRRFPLQQQQTQFGQLESHGQNFRPPNYHYYRTLHQQHQQQQGQGQGQSQGRVRNRGKSDSVDQEIVRDRDRDQAKGRNEYNYHYYQTRDSRSQQQQTGGGRPLPYERPSYSRDGQRGEWRDPWRRSTSPGGRRKIGASGSEQQRLSRQGGRSHSRSATNSPGGPSEKRRRTSMSSSGSFSSATSRSMSSAGGVANREPQGNAGPRDSSVPAAAPQGKRKHSLTSPRSGGSSPRYGNRRASSNRRSTTPMDSDRTRSYASVKGQDGGHARSDVREPSDVASRAAAKALHGGSRSPTDNEPRAFRRTSNSGTSGGRSSAASGASGFKRKRGPGSQTPPPTRPLSPPPPAPFLSSASNVGGKSDARHGQTSFQQRSDDRKPIKMTIVNKSKVRTNIYDADDGDPIATPVVDAIEDSNVMPQPIPSQPRASTSGTSDGGLPSKTKSPTDSGSGGENRVMSRREELLRQLRAVEHAIDAKRKREKKAQ